MSTCLDQRLNSIKGLINNRCIIKVNEKSIELASGKKSNYYINIKPVIMDPEGSCLIGSSIGLHIGPYTPSYVGGLEVGSIPVTMSVVSACYNELGFSVFGFFVRKKRKEYGVISDIEGITSRETLNNKRVVMLEDVTTTGNSIIKASEVVRSKGGNIVKAITVIDREQGARESCEKADIPFHCLFSIKDFKDVYKYCVEDE